MNLRVKEICKEKGITIQELADNMEMKKGEFKPCY